MAHILIVEDEAHIAQMIEATLSLGGYTSEICSDGEKAVERIFAGGFTWRNHSHALWRKL